MQWIKKIKCFL